MARFDRSIATAERLIKRNGQSVIWRNIVTGDDPVEPWKQVPGTPVNNPVDICFLPPDTKSQKFFAYLRGTNDVGIGYLQGLMKGNISFEPKLKDIVLRDGVELVIRSIDLLSPNGQKVLYTVEFEK